MSNTTDLFRKRLVLFLDKQEKLDQYADRLSNLRLLSFLGGLLVTVLAFVYTNQGYGYTVLGFSFIIFIHFVLQHDKAIKQADEYRKLAEINKNCLQRISGEWTDFPDDGKEYVNRDHPYTNDLDIFGHASLFQWINTANTYQGRHRLQSLLANPKMDVGYIKKKQEAIQELASKLEFCQGLQCAGMECEGLSDNPEKLLDYAENGKKLFNAQWIKSLFYVIPGITILSFVMLFFQKSIFYIPFAFVLIQIVVNLVGYRKVNAVLATMYSRKRKVEAYQHLLALVEKENFYGGYLSELQSNLFEKNKSASQQIKNLDKIVGATEMHNNPLVHVFINNIVFWDFHCAFALEKWKERSGSCLRNWGDTLGIFETLSSMALIAQISPESCYPHFVENGPFIAAEEMGHPLIPEENRVVNELVIENQICVITGSNMSGKTTLLRTTGINLVLAYAGAPVCAKQFSCSLMDIFTSMRISDDLNSGISTFYAELLRIKMIIDYARQNQPMLFLVDEVFRGTNSHDRVTGARSVVMNLNQPWIIGLISTHDFELCDFENDPSGRIINYHFIETYSGNEIHFDYKLRQGRCKTTNARYLMKMVGIDLMDNGSE